jgi:hypothetical protein
MIKRLDIEKHPMLEILMCRNEPAGRGLGSKNSRFRLQNRIVLTKRSKSAIKAPGIRIRNVQVVQGSKVQNKGKWPNPEIQVLGSFTGGQESLEMDKLLLCEER